MGTRQKHAGGMANFRGNLYESHFGTWRVLLALQRLLGAKATKLALQLEGCHVDDWAEDAVRERRFFQLKCKQKVSWREVRESFERQLAEVSPKSVTVTLTVPHELLATELRGSPKAVRGARVLVFPEANNPQGILVTPLVSRTVKAMCVELAPTASALEAIWREVDFAWQKVRKPGRFVPAAAVLRSLSDQTFPPLRFAWQPTKAWSEAEVLLRRVRGFSFTVDGGHFVYKDGDGTAGRMCCTTAEFKRFVRNVKKSPPKNLDDLRGIL